MTRSNTATLNTIKCKYAAFYIFYVRSFVVGYNPSMVMWAREHCRISPPRFLAVCRNSWLNQPCPLWETSPSHPILGHLPCFLYLCVRLLYFSVISVLCIRDLQSFVIRFDFESYVRFEIRFVLMVRFEIFESSAQSIVIRKKRLVVVKFAFKVDFGSKISVQQHCLTHFMTELK